MKKKFFLLLLVFSFSGCSNDDNSKPDCDFESSIEMTVNGKTYTFIKLGFGMDLTPDGYKLSLQFESYDPETEERVSMSFKLPYGKTGHNIFEEFHINFSNNIGYGNIDLIAKNGNTEVMTNSGHCFEATFSVSFQMDNETANITNGEIRNHYDENIAPIQIGKPLDEKNM